MVQRSAFCFWLPCIIQSENKNKPVPSWWTEWCFYKRKTWDVMVCCFGPFPLTPWLQPCLSCPLLPYYNFFVPTAFVFFTLVDFSNLGGTSVSFLCIDANMAIEFKTIIKGLFIRVVVMCSKSTQFPQFLGVRQQLQSVKGGCMWSATLRQCGATRGQKLKCEMYVW